MGTEEKEGEDEGKKIARLNLAGLEAAKKHQLPDGVALVQHRLAFRRPVRDWEDIGLNKHPRGIRAVCDTRGPLVLVHPAKEVCGRGDNIVR